MKCKYEGCQEGHYCYGYHPAEYVTRDMASDACDMSLEGNVYRQEEYEWGGCPCCEGHWEDCDRCSGRNQWEHITCQNFETLLYRLF
jgi:hypothetical protein